MDSDVAPERGPSLFITLESLHMDIMTGKKDDVCSESITPYCRYLDLLRYTSVGEWRIVEEILSPTKQKERGRRGSLHDGPEEKDGEKEKRVRDGVGKGSN